MMMTPDAGQISQQAYQQQQQQKASQQQQLMSNAFSLAKMLGGMQTPDTGLTNVPTGADATAMMPGATNPLSGMTTSANDPMANLMQARIMASLKGLGQP